MIDLDEYLAEACPGTEFLRMDGYDDCCVGVVTRFGQQPLLCYDKDAVLAKLINEGCGDYDEALEYFEVNQIGAWAGDATPCFIERRP
jgi:hypothetical protein